MAPEIGVGLVGYGLAGRVFHGMLVRNTPGLSVKAIVTRHPERRRAAEADFPGAAVYDDYARLLEDDSVSLVVLGTPHDTHVAMAVQAAERGRHVVVDKVMALSAAEADRMIEAAERHRVLLSVFHNRRWDSDFLTIKRALDQGWIGKPYVVESSVVGFRRPPEGQLPWRMQKKHGGGPFRDWGAHLVDQAVQLFGADPVAVRADFQYRWPGIDVETAATCDLLFANGVRYRVEVGHISMIKRPRWYVRGSRGSLVIWGLDPQEAALKEGRVIGGTEEAKMPASACELASEVPGAKLEIVPGDYTVFYRGVAEAIRTGGPPPVDPCGVRDALRVMDRAIEGRWEA